MSARACEHCGGRRVLVIADETIICPAHPELHTDEGLPAYTVASVRAQEVSEGQPWRHARWFWVGIFSAFALWLVLVVAAWSENPALGVLLVVVPLVMVGACVAGPSGDLTEQERQAW